MAVDPKTPAWMGRLDHGERYERLVRELGDQQARCVCAGLLAHYATLNGMDNDLAHDLRRAVADVATISPTSLTHPWAVKGLRITVDWMLAHGGGMPDSLRVALERQARQLASLPLADDRELAEREHAGLFDNPYAQ